MTSPNLLPSASHYKDRSARCSSGTRDEWRKVREAIVKADDNDDYVKRFCLYRAHNLSRIVAALVNNTITLLTYIWSM
ncbi:hypothetical protein E2C01_077205 [Portunus trituberculatus]|uniref:Uncharacterized protein n=1 Tax=Portunus trituberculatus TaxID=210409 RepID=A0A5B7IJQ8_PORTR|nr:hypothetical protein [Portunus trituberculatus]